MYIPSELRTISSLTWYSAAALLLIGIGADIHSSGLSSGKRFEELSYASAFARGALDACMYISIISLFTITINCILLRRILSRCAIMGFFSCLFIAIAWYFRYSGYASVAIR